MPHHALLQISPALFMATLMASSMLTGCGGAAGPGAAESASSTGNAQAIQASIEPAPPAGGEVPGSSAPAAGGWSAWTKNRQPVFAGPYSLIGDPSVIRDGDTLRMAYNCFDPTRQRGAVCEALSTNGLDWTDAPLNDGIPGRLIQSRPGAWDDTHETPLIYKHGDETLLFFAGYVGNGAFFESFPAHLGLAISGDGINFSRAGSAPVLGTTPGGYDSDAIFSPTIVEHAGQLVMIYSGHCWSHCTYGPGVSLLAATSSDGRNWTKLPKPVLSKADVPWAKDGAAEADIVKGPDGYYYLFMSFLYGDDGHDIGVARSTSPLGPWDVNPVPIVRATAGEFDAKGPIAPSVLIEGGRVRMWFHGFGADNTIRIGYAESAWPLRTP